MSNARVIIAIRDGARNFDGQWEMAIPADAFTRLADLLVAWGEDPQAVADEMGQARQSFRNARGLSQL